MSSLLSLLFVKHPNVWASGCNNSQRRAMGRSTGWANDESLVVFQGGSSCVCRWAQKSRGRVLRTPSSDWTTGSVFNTNELPQLPVRCTSWMLGNQPHKMLSRNAFAACHEEGVQWEGHKAHYLHGMNVTTVVLLNSLVGPLNAIASGLRGTTNITS